MLQQKRLYKNIIESEADDPEKIKKKKQMEEYYLMYKDVIDFLEKDVLGIN